MDRVHTDHTPGYAVHAPDDKMYSFSFCTASFSRFFEEVAKANWMIRELLHPLDPELEVGASNNDMELSLA